MALKSSVRKETASLKSTPLSFIDVSLAASRRSQAVGKLGYSVLSKWKAGLDLYPRGKAALRATITWRDTWDLDFNHDAVEPWERVGPDPYCLRAKKQRVEIVLNFHGNAICYWHLPV